MHEIYFFQWIHKNLDNIYENNKGIKGRQWEGEQQWQGQSVFF